MKKPIPFGKYYLLERINVGGMAEVFRAKAYGVEGFERLVAVKRILPNIAEDKEFIGMFIDEAKLAVQLNHANIAQIFDLGMVESAYYIALEHIHGRDLRAIFDRCNERFQPMPIAQAAFVIMKVCEGLDYAHNKRDQSGRELNLVHRDVSPQNILVSFEGEVKLIDFGIAKAAGKGAQTQAGILKGKFGYMSPEQVRGLPIDRRTDIFSCGIVLYELLTGERLFVGESDFSTLEKVRNVEILPPSTYNRKIPEELERIVLKALAKDVEDRYQNAIDLHDELQAFVYMAGEFYSRKDLAAWMKDTFAREIEEETAKLESYRHFRPPEVKNSPVRASSQVATPHRSTLAMPSMANKPPPPPSRSSSQLPSYSARADEGLSWDDDELETQIYDSPDDLSPENMVARYSHGGPGVGPASTAPMGSMASGPGGSGPNHGHNPSHDHRDPHRQNQMMPPPGAGNLGPNDATMLNSTSRGWAAGPGAGIPAPGNDANSGSLLPPPKLAAGSNQAPSPFADPNTDIISAPGNAASDGSAFSPFETALPGDPMLGQKKSRSGLMVFLLALILVGGGGAAAYFLFFADQGEDDEVAATDGTPTTDGTTPSTTTLTPPGTTGGPVVTPDAGVAALPLEILAKTGFKLQVTPKNAEVKFDDIPIAGAGGTFQVLNLQPGPHRLVITGPEGYESKEQSVDIVAGAIQAIQIELEGIEVATTLESDPAGAKATLLEDGKDAVELGETPLTHKLRFGSSYKVRFEKDGYRGKTETVTLSGAPQETVAVTLRRRSTGGGGNNNNDAGDKTPKPSGKGVLRLSSKPVCKILIGGKDTGKSTPQRSLELPAGRHRITLVNDQFGIKESFNVTIKSGETVTRVKDLSDLIK